MHALTATATSLQLFTAQIVFHTDREHFKHSLERLNPHGKKKQCKYLKKVNVKNLPEILLRDVFFQSGVFTSLLLKQRREVNRK